VTRSIGLQKYDPSHDAGETGSVRASWSNWGQYSWKRCF